MSNDSSQQRLNRALYRIFRALARIVLRHGMSVRDLNDLLRKAFVDVAREDYGINGRPTNKARIATMTGLTRIEVARQLERPKPGTTEGASRHPLNRVVMRWLREEPWRDSNGQPKVLDVDKGEDSFAKLVDGCGGDLAWQTLLKELIRLNIAERNDDQVKLLRHGFLPGDSEAEGLPFLGEDVAALIDTIDNNLSNPEARRYQSKLVFPGLSEAGLAVLQKAAETEGQALLEKLDRELVSETRNGKDHLSGMAIFVFDHHNGAGKDAEEETD